MSSTLHRRGRALTLALGFTLLLVGRAVGEPPSRVLFIGNSLTYWNDLPLLVEAMAAASGLSLVSEAVTRADASLEDHWGDPIRAVIRKGGFKWVVLHESGLSLYAPDNLHPSRLGTYAAAATILSGLTGVSPIGLPHQLKLRNGDDYKVDEKRAALVLKAVAAVTRREKP
jgi:hypothetical protein